MFDVIVLGGGIVGAATAYALAQADKSIALIEQFEPGHSRGSSHGDGRVVRFNYTESIYVQMATLAYPAWEALSARIGRPLFQKTGLVEYGPAGCEPIATSEAMMLDYGIAYQKLDPADARRRFPQYAFADGTDVLYQPDGAVAFATPAVLALWELAQADGVQGFTGQRIREIQPGHDFVTLIAETGQKWTGKSLVVTAGAWTGQLLQQVGIDVPIVVTHELLSYFPPEETSTVSHRVGDMPVAIDYHTEAPFYSLPQVDVPGVKVGWHHTGNEVAADHPDADVEHLLRGAQGWIDRLYPHVNRNPIETQTCLYSNTPDYHFIIDHHPDYPNIVVGGGFSGHGFKFGPVLGQILADLAQGKATSVPLGEFSLERFQNPAQLQKRVGA